MRVYVDAPDSSKDLRMCVELIYYSSIEYIAFSAVTDFEFETPTSGDQGLGYSMFVRITIGGWTKQEEFEFVRR